MSDWENYVKDSRKICKYGAKCYQKNPEHHSTYKHPPNLKHNRNKHGKQRHSPYSRNTEKTTTKAEKTPEKDEDIEIPSDTTTVTPKPEQVDNKTSVNLPENIILYPASTNHDLIKELFLVDMPQDFYQFYDCLNDDNNIEKTLASINLELIGPYDLLLGKLPQLDDKELYLIHWRFFYDPPELQALIKKKGKSEYHLGYYRDDPNEQPVFVASNDSSKDYHIKPMASNLFGAVYLYLQSEMKTSPFITLTCKKLMSKLKQFADDHNISLEEYNMKQRQGKIVTKTLHGAGIVVPYNRKTQLGYRRLVETDANLKKLFTKLQASTTQEEKDKILSELQPVITYSSIAVDECDFGTGLEAGIALFCSGLKELEPSALSSLSAVYTLLNRDAFGKIIQAHLKIRRKGPNLSILSLSTGLSEV